MVALFGAAIHILHRRDRMHVYLTHPPGSIAASTALAYHSGFGELLLPYDDDETMARNLRALRFGFDQRTGAIYAEDLEEDRPSEELPVLMDREPSPKANEKGLFNPHDHNSQPLENPHERAISGSYEAYKDASTGSATTSPAVVQFKIPYEYEHFNPESGRDHGPTSP